MGKLSGVCVASAGGPLVGDGDKNRFAPRGVNVGAGPEGVSVARMAAGRSSGALPMK